VLDLCDLEVPHRNDGAELTVFIPKTPIESVKSAHVSVTNAWMAQTFEYTSPQGVMLRQGIVQEEDQPHLVAGDTLGIVILPTCEPTTLPNACARRAFGSMGVPLLRKFAGLWEIPIRMTDGTLFAILAVMISFLLECSEETLLEILLLRLVQYLPAWAALQDIPEIGDVVELADVAELEVEHQ